MRRIARSRSQRPDDAGAVAIIVAILTAFGVVLGMLAITSDIGNIMFERRQLQNGADGAAMSLARSCAKKASDCTEATAATTFANIAGKNALDGKTAIASICARNVVDATTKSAWIKTCALPAVSDNSNLGRCNYSSVTDPTPWVEVTTRTLTSSNGNTVFTPFARALAGGGSQGTTVVACSRAAIVTATGTGSTIPIVASPCEWSAATNGGTNFAPSPSYSTTPGAPDTSSGSLPNLPTEIETPAVTPPTHYATAIGAHADIGNCTFGNGQTYPGGFSWTDGGLDCSAIFDATGTVLIGSNGASVPSNCSGTVLQKYLGKEVYIPIGVSLSGQTYTIDGVASFYLAGFANLPSTNPKSVAIYKEPNYVCTGKCNGSTQYLWGWFTSSIKPVSSLGGLGGADRGAKTIVPAG